MLIRQLEGTVFHKVRAESKDNRFFICLCGRVIKKDSLEEQIRPNGAYSRCWTCCRIENTRIKLRYARPPRSA